MTKKMEVLRRVKGFILRIAGARRWGWLVHACTTHYEFRLIIAFSHRRLQKYFVAKESIGSIRVSPVYPFP